MNQRKPNKIAWYSLGLTMLLCIALLVVATGTAQARYRAEREEEIDIAVRVPEQIQLGTVSIQKEDVNGTEEPAVKEIFTPTTQLAWETANGITQLKFAVANGTSETDFSIRDQEVRLRMIGTLGIWTGTQTPQLSITLPPEEEDGEEKIIQATVTPFVKGTALHHTYGDGWLYTFLDEEGEELIWELPGEELSFVSFAVTLEGEAPENINLLQPYMIAEPVED